MYLKNGSYDIFEQYHILTGRLLKRKIQYTLRDIKLI